MLAAINMPNSGMIDQNISKRINIKLINMY